MNQWWNYVVRIAGTDEQKRIADDSKIGTTVISRWFKGHNEPSAKLVVSFARAHNRPPVEALIAAGYLDESDVGDTVEIHRGLDGLSDDELLAEVRRRMRGERNDLEAAETSGASTEGRQAQEAGSADDAERARVLARLQARLSPKAVPVENPDDRRNER